MSIQRLFNLRSQEGGKEGKEKNKGGGKPEFKNIVAAPVQR